MKATKRHDQKEQKTPKGLSRTIERNPKGDVELDPGLMATQHNVEEGCGCLLSSQQSECCTLAIQVMRFCGPHGSEPAAPREAQQSDRPGLALMLSQIPLMAVPARAFLHLHVYAICGDPSKKSFSPSTLNKKARSR